MKKLRSLIGLAAMLAVAAITGPSLKAQSIQFPQPQQAGTAVVSDDGETLTLGNDLLTASFVREGGTLMFGGCEAMNLVAGTELFTITLSGGQTIKASQMTLGDVRTLTLTPDATAARGSEKLSGKAIEADFTYGNLSLTWRAVLRDGSHYLRTELALTANRSTAMQAITPMLYNVDNDAAGSTPVVVGNTRGAVLASEKIFAGLETPMGINTVSGTASAEAFAYTAWNSAYFSDNAPEAIPAGITALGLTAGYLKIKQGYLAIKDAGTHTVTFKYTSGSHRLDVAGVDVLDAFTGEVVASDYHKGYTGGSSSANVYSLDIPTAGYYLVRYFRDITEEANGVITGSWNSNGSITWTGNVSAPNLVYDGALDKNVLATDVVDASTLTNPVLNTGGTRTDQWNTSSWTVVETPAQAVTDMGYYNPKVKYMAKPIAFAQGGGTLSATYVYQSGTHGLTICGVELIDADGNVAASDYHKGFSGTRKTDNTYTFTVRTAGDYTLRYLCVLGDDDNTSSGNINLSYVLNETLHLPALKGVGIEGKWSRNTTLAAGNTWNVSAVVGLIAPGQARRSFLCYSERERAVPWRPFPVYVSWYELNIDRNNSADYSGNMTSEQCVDVMNHWKTDFYDKYGETPAAFVWDDGWDEYGTWTFNPNFPEGFSPVDRIAQQMGGGIGAWLGPVGGYGTSGTYRRNYWSSKGGMQLSNAAYYNVFYNACKYMLDNYDFRFFKFDGISAQWSSVGPDAGTTGEENAEGIIAAEQAMRRIKPDIFFNTTVGTWASPFWFHISDAVWRQENDYGEIGNQGTDREKWITYRDRLVYQNFVQNSPLCPINTLMTHGFILTKYGNVSKNMDYAGVLREMRCAFACGSGMVELYNDYELMNSINGGKLWADLAECIAWQRDNADVLPDVHWVGGNPWDGSKANVYGWAAWNGTRGTLAIRNPSTSAQSVTTTFREVFEIPAHLTGKVTFAKAFAANQLSLGGINTSKEYDIDEKITYRPAGSNLYVFNATFDFDGDETPIGHVTIDDTTASDNQDGITYDLQGRRTDAASPGIYIIGGRKIIKK
ncbi:MAG: hypothetical protein IJS89_08540 [Bacteroidaceae bacterium]|nr:hypothetical protein [Bacteroidaceae bacterium]